MKTLTLACTLLSLAVMSPVWAYGVVDSNEPKATYTANSTDSSGHGRDGKHHRKGKIHEKLKNMSEEERKAFREEVKEKWNALSDEDKEAFKAKVKERKAKKEDRRLMRQYGAELLKQQDNP